MQAGFGKYKQEEEPVAAATTAGVDIDACTFDRVLLYLEHAARGWCSCVCADVALMECCCGPPGEAFLFDPLLAGDLLVAAQKLGLFDFDHLYVCLTYISVTLQVLRVYVKSAKKCLGIFRIVSEKLQ